MSFSGGTTANTLASGLGSCDLAAPASLTRAARSASSTASLPWLELHRSGLGRLAVYNFDLTAATDACKCRRGFSSKKRVFPCLCSCSVQRSQAKCCAPSDAHKPPACQALLVEPFFTRSGVGPQLQTCIAEVVVSNMTYSLQLPVPSRPPMHPCGGHVETQKHLDKGSKISANAIVLLQAHR